MSFASLTPRPALVLPAMLLAQVGALLPHAAFPAQVTVLRDFFGLTNLEAGWISGSYYLGYMVMVPVLMGLTDRMDARRVYLCGALLSSFATFAFAFLAQGFWSAIGLRIIAGAGLAALYMPGLRVLSDRMGSDNSRAITLYTAHYALGVALSFLVAGWAGEAFGWQAAFFATGAGPLLSFAAVALAVAAKPLDQIVRRNPFDFRPVLSNPAALRFVTGYAVHGYEMFAERAWIVAFLGAAIALQTDLHRGAVDLFGFAPSVAGLAALGALLGLPGSVAGNELALRIGRTRLIRLAMASSFVTGLAMGFSIGGPFWLTALLVLLHAVLMTADSGALTSGLVKCARKGEEGVTIAFHSMMGFGASFFGPLGVGFALDLARAQDWSVATGWILACGMMGAPSILALFIFRGSDGRGRADAPPHRQP